MSTIEYPNRPQRKSQLARYALALVFSLLSKRVSRLADWIGLLHVDSREVASGSTLAMIHAVMGWPCAEITHRPARYRRRVGSQEANRTSIIPSLKRSRSRLHRCDGSISMQAREVYVMSKIQKRLWWLRTTQVSTLLLLFYLLLLVSGVAAQTGTVGSANDGTTPSGSAPGSPTGSYAVSDFEVINPYNGHVSLAFPLLKVGGRGAAGYSMTLPIDQTWTARQFTVAYQCMNGNCPGPATYYNATLNWWTGLRPGFTAGVVQGRRVGGFDTQGCNNIPELWGVGHRYLPATVCGGNNIYIIGTRNTLTRLTFIGPDNSEIELRDQATGGQPISGGCNSQTPGFNRGRTFVSADGSGLTFVSDADISDIDCSGAYPAGLTASSNVFGVSGYLHFSSGIVYRIDGGKVSWIRDPDGNQTTFGDNSVTDSLGRQITFSSGSDYSQINFAGFGGAPRTLRIHYASLSTDLRSDQTIQTYHQLFPEIYDETNSPGPSPYDVGGLVSELELPDGRAYHFYYNSYAEVARIELPTGGAIEYDYAAGVDLPARYSGVLGSPNSNKEIYRRVSERRLYPNGGSGANYARRTTYSHNSSDSDSYYTSLSQGSVTVDDRDASGTLLARTKHYYYGSPVASLFLGWDSPATYGSWREGKEYQTEAFAADGTTVLRRVNHDWQQRAPVNWWSSWCGQQGSFCSSNVEPRNDPRIIRTTTTLVESNQVTKQEFAYDQFNNRTDESDFDFGAGTPPTYATRHTHTDYLTINPVNGVDYTLIDIHRRSLPLRQWVKAVDPNTGQESTTYAANSEISYDEPAYPLIPYGPVTSWNDPGTIPRGKPTTIRRWLDSTNSWIETHAQFDQCGSVRNTWDAKGNQSQIEYSGVYAYAYPTLTRTPVPDPSGQHGSANALVFTKVFDFNTGLATSSTDANNVTSTLEYNDALNRPTRMVRAYGTSVQSQSSIIYDDVNRFVTTTTDQSAYNDNVLKSQVVYDGLGRTIESREYEGGTNYIATQTQYDALGRPFKTSNPFRPWNGESAVWTTSAFDALGRVVTITTSDSATVTTSYSGNTVTVTDQAGKQRQSVTDGLGRLIQIYEDPGSLNYLTSYSYDALDDLTAVNQGTQMRTFVYDSLKRLSSATNPESGTFSYQYDNNGNLTQKTDARGVVSTYPYDALNRNYSVNYTNDPANTSAASRTYDGGTNGKGKLWTTQTAGNAGTLTTIDSYDALGRPLTERQQFYTGSAWSRSFSQSLSYDRAGHVLTEAYPSGRTVTYVYDSAGRMNNFTGNLGDGTVRTYSTGVIYASGGQIAQEQFGTVTPIYNKLSYNSRQQLSEILAGTTGGDANFNRGKIVNDYSDQCSGAACNGTDNNGNLKKQTVFIPNNEQNTTWTSWNQQYGYDSLNRLTQVHEYTGSPNLDWQQSYNYDRWGNRLINNNGTDTWGQGINNVSASIDANTNRMYATGDPNHALIDYDNAGNQTKDYLTSNGTRNYDAENRMITATDSSSQISRYTYDGDGKRVRRNIGNQETWQVYGLGGELLAEYGPNASPLTPQKEYGYRNGQLLITATAPSGLAANKPSDTKTEAVAAASPVSGKESTAAAQSVDLLASIKNLMLRLPGISTVTTASTEAISDTSTPLFGTSFPYASLNRTALPLMPQSGSAKIAFASNRDGSAQIYSMNTDGSGLSRLTNDAANDEAPNWSPNNSRIVFQSDRDNLFSGLADIYVMNWDGSGQARLTTDANDDSAPVWSPDGTKIAFQSARNGASYQIYVMNADGSGQVNVSNSAANDTQPSWSSDGSKIAFASDRDQAGFSSIYVMNANGTNQTRLTISGTGLLDQQPAWSPDGTRLTFTSTRDSIVQTWQETDDNGGIVTKSKLLVNKEVYVMNANGSAQVRLTNTLENDGSASWSGDGTKIVFRSERERDCCDPTQQVWVMNSDGSSQVNLSVNPYGDHCPSWQHLASNVPPTVSVTSPANGATLMAPANITITASASDSDGTISKVDFYQGTTLIGTDTIAPYSFNWNNFAAGSYSLTAKATDNGGATSTSGAVTVTVNSAPSVSITSPTSGAIFNAPANITISANASDSDGSVSRVDFYQGATLIGTATSSPYAISWNNVAAGSYTLTARATDNLGATTSSAPVNITVDAPPAVSITSPANGATFTAPANITISANASDSDGSISRVDFYQGTTLIGTATTSPYTITWNNVVAGGYTLTARATDNLGAITTSNPISISVGSPPVVSVTTPANGASFTAPANVTLTANASSSTGSISRVEFYQDTTLIGTSTASPYTISWNNVTAGSYTLKARAVDNSGASTDSTPVNISVNAPPTVSVTSPTTGASFTAPANITVTANASDSDGSISRVDFYQGPTLIGTAATSPYSFNWTNVMAGSYSLTAKATDNLGAQTNSTVVNITVITPVADIRWIVTDQLGTPRMSFDQTGSLAGVSRHDYLPFGEELFAGTGGRTAPQGYTLSDNVRQKFTQKERDIETGLDYFGARYYASTQGRFTGADPLMASGRTGRPQSWNRYTYVLNNPLRFIDPSGMLEEDDQELKHPPPARRNGDPIPSSPNGSEQGVIARITVAIGPATTEPIQTNETPIATSVEMRPTEAPSPTPSNAGAPTFKGVSFGLSAGLIGGTINVKRDKFGNWYISGGPSFGLSTPVNGSVILGGDTWQNGVPVTDERGVRNILSGPSASVTGALAGPGMGGSWNTTLLGFFTTPIPTGANGTVYAQVGTPEVSYSPQLTFRVPRLKW